MKPPQSDWQSRALAAEALAVEYLRRLRDTEEELAEIEGQLEASEKALDLITEVMTDDGGYDEERFFERLATMIGGDA